MIRVLIAEDDPQCARQLRQFLDSYSQETGRTFRITHYDNGEDLVERYQPEFDLLLLDCELHAQRRLDFLDGMEEEIRTYEAQNKTGNSVLDNAIECELTIQDKKKRLIHLAVYAKRDFLVIQCGNYCEDTPEFQDGLPVSTKGDGAYHGFGVKSIRRAAEKYGGTMTIHTRDSWFELNIVIPITTPLVLNVKQSALFLCRSYISQSSLRKKTSSLCGECVEENKICYDASCQGPGRRHVPAKRKRRGKYDKSACEPAVTHLQPDGRQHR